ncbi:MAG: HEAT repeat domain-containing protein, partial [Vicinamibacterales bacterium]
MVAATLVPPCLVVPVRAAAQQQAVPTLSAEDRDAIATMAQGWALLSGGDLDGATARARELQAAYPRSGAVLDLLVEIAIARGGWRAALGEYEQWLGARTMEEPRVVRRIALALLGETTRQGQHPAARVAALQALTADGDAWAAQVLAAGASAGAASETRAMAALGSRGAVENLIQAFEVGATDALGAMQALGQSRSPLAIPLLIRQLDNPKPEIRGGAAEALGHLGGPDAIARLRQVVRDDTPYVRGRAAGALYRLGDDTGLPILRDLAASDAPAARLAAAKALAPRPDATWRALVDDLARSDDPDIRLGAAGLLIEVDADRARDVLSDLAQSQNAAIREQA